MGSNDGALTILIIIIFIILYMFNILAVGLKNIKEDWPKYRCNPIVMPMAGALSPDGKSASENFTYCIQTMQKDYMQYLLQPVNYNLNVLGSNASAITDSLNNVRAFFNNLRNMITEVIQNVFGVFLNLVIEFQRITINIKDLFGKTLGIMTTLLYTLSGSVMTMESMWKGPPGKTVKALCFKPDTLLQTKNGEFVKMEDIKLGEILKNGRGEHLIYNPESKKFEHVNENQNYKETSVSSDYFSCLITSDHVILIGDNIFHDWEDSNGSSCKDV